MKGHRGSTGGGDCLLQPSCIGIKIIRLKVRVPEAAAALQDSDAIQTKRLVTIKKYFAFTMP